MKTFRILLVILAFLCLLPVGSALAQAETFHDNGRIPVDENLWNECTNEYVHLTGTMLWTNHGVITPSGMLQWGFLNRYQGVTGMGQTSGIKYQATGGGEQGYGTAVADPDRPYHYSAGSNLTIRLVAQGNAPDLLITARGHLTVTPDYRWLTHVDNYELLCK